MAKSSPSSLLAGPMSGLDGLTDASSSASASGAAHGYTGTFTTAGGGFSMTSIVVLVVGALVLWKLAK